MPVTLPRYPAEYEVKVDWLNTGNFAGASDDVTSDVLDGVLTVEHGRDQARPLGEPLIPAADYELNNDDRTYSPENAGSPVYGLMYPGRAATISATIGVETGYNGALSYDDPDLPYDGLATMPLVTGVVDDITQSTGWGQKRTGIRLLGSMLKLRGRRVTWPITVGPTTGQAVDLLLDLVSWPAAKRAISTGDTTLAYWWLDDRDAYEALVELFYSEGAGAALYEDGDGVIHFESRSYRASATRSTASQTSIRDITGAVDVGYDAPLGYDDPNTLYDGASPIFYEALAYSPGYRDVVNDATVESIVRTIGSLSVVWTYSPTLTLGANETRILIASASDPIASPVVPVAATDYTVSAGSVTPSIPLATWGGRQVGIQFTAGAGGATLTGIQLRGYPMTGVSTLVKNQTTAAVTSSITRYGTRSQQIACWPEIDANSAQALADAYIAYMAETRPIVEIRMGNADGRILYQQLKRQVSDRITVHNDHLGVVADFWIEQIRHEVSGGGRRVDTVFVCQRALTGDQGAALWDSGLWDTGLWSS